MKNDMKTNQNLTSKLVSRYHDEAKTKLWCECHVDQFDQKQGEYKDWYFNGQISFIRNFKDGKLHGKVQDWWDDGTRWYIDTRHFKKEWHGTKIEFKYEK